MNKENYSLKLVDEIILYYDVRSKKHQIADGVTSCTWFCILSVTQKVLFASNNKRKVSKRNYLSLADDLEIYGSLVNGLKAEFAMAMLVSQYIYRKCKDAFQCK